jgi:hypothetical protein
MVLAMLPSAVAAQERPSDGSIYRWNNGRWMQVDGYGTRISVGPDGAPWVINSRNEIFHWNQGAFDKMPGLARDIGVGGDGTAWIIGTDQGIYKWTGSDWARMEGHGVAISVDRSGSPWVVNTSSEIYQLQNGNFVARSGKARDIGAGDDIWLIGTDNQVYRAAPTSGCRWAAAVNASARARTGRPGLSTRPARSSSGTTVISTSFPVAMQWTSARMPRARSGSSGEPAAPRAEGARVRRPRFEP